MIAVAADQLSTPKCPFLYTFSLTSASFFQPGQSGFSLRWEMNQPDVANPLGPIDTGIARTLGPRRREATRYSDLKSIMSLLMLFS